MAAYEPARPLDLSDHERRDDAGEHQHGEHIDEECIPALLPQPWQRRVLVDDPDHGDKDRREQDDESPEDRRVHQARQEALEELALSHDHHRFGTSAGGQVVEAFDWLAHPNEPVEEERTATEQRDRDDQNNGKDRRGDHPLSPSGRGPGRGACTARLLRSSAEIAGTISLRSPTTA